MRTLADVSLDPREKRFFGHFSIICVAPVAAVREDSSGHSMGCARNPPIVTVPLYMVTISLYSLCYIVSCLLPRPDSKKCQVISE